jgi:hypothetical protein
MKKKNTYKILFGEKNDWCNDKVISWRR